MLFATSCYRFTNHLGNVMAVITDKVVDSTNTNLASDILPAQAHRKTSIKVAYDYYPFGMLMPQRYIEDHTEQCMPITQTIYYTHWKSIHQALLEQPAELSDFGLFPIDGNIEVNLDPSAHTLQAISPATGNIASIYHIVTTGVQANKELNLSLNVRNNAEELVTISLMQQNANNEWEAFASTTVAREDHIELKGTPQFGLPIKVILSGVNLNIGISGYLVTRHDLLAGTEISEICNTSLDFDEDYRFGFNGQ